MQDLPLIRNSWKLLTHKCLFYSIFLFQSCRVVAFLACSSCLSVFVCYWATNTRHLACFSRAWEKVLLPGSACREDEWKFCTSNAKEIGTWVTEQMAPSVYERGIASREVVMSEDLLEMCVPVRFSLPLVVVCGSCAPSRVLEGQSVSRASCYLAWQLIGLNKEKLLDVVWTI